MSWSRGCRCLMSSAALLLPSLAATESHLQTEAAGTAIRATAHVDFKIVVPRVLSMELTGGNAGRPAPKSVAIMSNGHNVTVAAAVRAAGARESVRGNTILNSAARRIIAQDAACTLGVPQISGSPAASAGPVVCTASVP